ncbi:MAG: GNAT family N-acetyltransferase, partial [Oscillospiraceae bacterium]
MIIRNFSKDDRTEFLSMCKEFYTSGAANEPIPFKNMERTFEYVIKSGTHLKGLIFEEDGKVAGYGLVILFYSNEAGGLIAFLDEIFVKEAFRGKGIGHQYLEQIENYLCEDCNDGDEFYDIVGMRLEVCDSNKGAKKLYNNMGFCPLE